MVELPLFPLNIVLFPGMLLPLHIFEERYKAMINDCLENGSPFGVLLSDLEEEEVDPPYSVGTTAHIVQLDKLEDGRMNIIVLGRQRFRVQHTLRREPYLVADVEFYPLRAGDPRENRERTLRVRNLFGAYVDLLGKAMGTRLHVQRVPNTPLTLAYLVAIVLQTSLDEKQQLLELPTYSDLLRQEEILLNREKALLTYILETQPKEEDLWPYRPQFSLN